MKSRSYPFLRSLKEDELDKEGMCFVFLSFLKSNKNLLSFPILWDGFCHYHRRIDHPLDQLETPFHLLWVISRGKRILDLHRTCDKMVSKTSRDDESRHSSKTNRYPFLFREYIDTFETALGKTRASTGSTGVLFHYWAIICVELENNETQSRTY